MKKLQEFGSKLTIQMEKELFHLRLKHQESSNWALMSIPILKNCLDQAKQYVRENPFKDNSEKNYFYEKIKAKVLCNLIFISEVYEGDLGALELVGLCREEYFNSLIRNLKKSLKCIELAEEKLPEYTTLARINAYRALINHFELEQAPENSSAHSLRSEEFKFAVDGLIAWLKESPGTVPRATLNSLIQIHDQYS